MKNWLYIALLLFPVHAIAKDQSIQYQDPVPNSVTESWTNDLDTSTPISIVINIDQQVLNVIQNGHIIVETQISSGRPGYDTPVGMYHVQGMTRLYRSKHYHATMPLAIWFDMQNGIAMHVGSLPGYPDSHGCIHLSSKFAHELYSVVHVGDTVIVQGG